MPSPVKTHSPVNFDYLGPVAPSNFPFPRSRRAINLSSSSDGSEELDSSMPDPIRETPLDGDIDPNIQDIDIDSLDDTLQYEFDVSSVNHNIPMSR